MPSPLKWIVYWTIFLFILFLVAYVGLNVAAIYDPVPERKQLFATIAVQVGTIGREGWWFIKPFLQLIVVLVIISWILDKFGVNLHSKVFQFEWNVQTLIALLVIGAFTIAALGGITAGIGTLQDLALVVIGFYFGSQRKSVEIQTPEGTTTVVEEHENELKTTSSPARSETSEKPE